MSDVHFTKIFALLMGLCTAAGPLRASEPDRPPQTQPATLFDPARHMSVAEVRTGMKGYGLSVFKGTKIERFEVEVLSVLKNFGPKHDVILVRCSGANLEHTGSIAGMSGSPIYLTDERGRRRLVGAFAYGWPLMKDPVGGVQPIEYMLRMRADATAEAPATQAADANAIRLGSPPRWRLSDSIPLPGSRNVPRDYPFAAWNSIAPNPRLGNAENATTQLRPLMTPLMASGLSPRLLEQLGPIFQAYGILPVQAGGGLGASHSSPDSPAAAIAPGSVLAVPLITGDIDMTAVGTCTEVIDEHVFGFGHAFMSEGPVVLPMGAGQIHGVIANLMTSFKLGSLTQARGTVYADQTVGIAGRLGPEAPTVPISLRVKYADGTQDQEYNFQAALHARFTPLLTVAALTEAIGGEHDLPQFHTLDYDLTTKFANGRTLRLKNTSVNASAAELFFELGGPMIAAADNPYERVLVRHVSGTVTITPQAREAQILSVNVPRLKFRPGETLKAFVTYRPFRGDEALLPIEFALPRDLSDGTYQLSVSDWTKYLADEQAAKPFRFTAESVDEVFAVMHDFNAIRHDAVYVRLVREADGVAIGRSAMPSLPSSRRQVLIGAGRSNITPFVSSIVKAVPARYVMSGSAEFSITIDKHARVQVGGPPGTKAEPAEPSAPPRTDEPARTPPAAKTPARPDPPAPPTPPAADVEPAP